MNSLEFLVELIECQSPSHITILAPEFNPTFLWRLSKDTALYKRNKLSEIRVFVLNFTDGADANFFLNESIELQELFPKIKIFKINLSLVKAIVKMAPGVILMINGVHKAYTFETAFSSTGFNVQGVLSGIPVSRALDYFGNLETQSIRVSRALISSLLTLCNTGDSQDLGVEFSASPVFELSFISAKTNKIHNAGAGLNWGQRTSTRGRKDLNAAYIHVPKFIQQNQLLPRQGVIFSCRFEDGIEFDLVRTGEGGKNLTSAYENQILGRYVRYRLGISPGVFINDATLRKNNILGISFIKTSDQKYLARFNNSSDSRVFECKHSCATNLR